MGSSTGSDADGQYHMTYHWPSSKANYHNPLKGVKFLQVCACKALYMHAESAVKSMVDTDVLVQSEVICFSLTVLKSSAVVFIHLRHLNGFRMPVVRCRDSSHNLITILGLIRLWFQRNFYFLLVFFGFSFTL